jgi:pimeloyl-ACP methyl ester carboxylesterase
LVFPSRLPLLLTLLLSIRFAPAQNAYTDYTHPSATFAEPRHYRAFLPKNYETSTKSYPVIYYFHGHSDRYTLERYDAGLDTVPKIAAFVAAHDVIVIAADGYVARDYTGFYGGWPYDLRRAGGEFDYGRYFGELVQHIDSRYRTLSSRRHRATSGLSMGGFMSLYLSQRFPELIGSASAFNPGHEFLSGEPGRRSLWRIKDHIANQSNTMVRLVRASGDYISQYHEVLRAAYASAPSVVFEFRQDEYHRHWATSIAETFDFHMRAFSNPALDTTQEEWSYSNAFQSFQVRGYQLTLAASDPAVISLHNVSQGALTITTRRWAPDGPPASCARLKLVTAPLYRPGDTYLIADLDLAAGAARSTSAVADPQGRITLNTTCSGHSFSFIGNGTGGQPPQLLPLTAHDLLRVRPGKIIQIPVRLYNPRATAMENVTVELSSDYPTVELLHATAQLKQIPAHTVADLSTPFQVRFTAGEGDFARIRLKLIVTYDGYLTRKAGIDVLVAPDPLNPPTEIVVLDGRTHTFRCFRQKGNQGGGFTVERTVTEGKGNGNGVLEPGEEGTFWVRLPQGLDPFDKGNWHRAKVYFDSPLLAEIADIQEDKQREWTGAQNRTSLIRLSSAAAAGEIPIILDRESWSFHFSPGVRYGPEPLYQAFQFHRHHIFTWTLKVPAVQ